jgi:hypothetical protein
MPIVPFRTNDLGFPGKIIAAARQTQVYVNQSAVSQTRAARTK